MPPFVPCLERREPFGPLGIRLEVKIESKFARLCSVLRVPSCFGYLRIRNRLIYLRRFLILAAHDANKISKSALRNVDFRSHVGNVVVFDCHYRRSRFYADHANAPAEVSRLRYHRSAKALYDFVPSFVSGDDAVRPVSLLRPARFQRHVLIADIGLR